MGAFRFYRRLAVSIGCFILFGTVPNENSIASSPLWIVEPFSNETELSLPPHLPTVLPFNALFIEQAIPSVDRRFLFFILRSDNKDRDGVRKKKWLAVALPLTGEQATVFRFKGNAILSGFEPIGESEFLCTTNGDGIPERSWRCSPTTKTVEAMPVESPSDSALNISLGARLLIREIAIESNVDKYLPKLWKENYATRFVGHDGKRSQSMVSKGIGSNQIVFAKNTPFGVKCWNMQSETIDWEITSDKISDLLQQNATAQHISCWIPTSTFEGQKEVPILVWSHSKTAVVAVNEVGKLRRVCDSVVSYPCGSPLMASAKDLVVLCYSRNQPRPDMLMELCTYDLETGESREISRHMSQIIVVIAGSIYCHSRLGVFRVPLETLEGGTIVWPEKSNDKPIKGVKPVN